MTGRTRPWEGEERYREEMGVWGLQDSIKGEQKRNDRIGRRRKELRKEE